MFRRITSIFALVAIFSSSIEAQHPIEVQKLAASGEYFKALATYDRMPQRIATPPAMISAARSAWALGLPDRALQEYERALTHGELNDVEKARISISKGAIELQEERYRVSLLHAEKAVKLLPEASPLRSRALMLWAESLFNLGSYASAETKYMDALEESANRDKGEIYFHLAKCQLKLGKYMEAYTNLQRLPLDHERIPQAIKQLAKISVKVGEPEHVIFWLKKGVEEHADQFLDSWVNYAMIRAAIDQGDLELVRKTREEATQKFPPSDAWVALMHAAAEAYEWELSQVRN